MEINSSTIMETIPKTTDHPFDFLDLAVDRLAQGVGDAMPRIDNKRTQVGDEGTLAT